MKHFDIQKSFNAAKKAPVNNEWQALGRAKLVRYVAMQPIKSLSGVAESPHMTFPLFLKLKPMFALILIAAVVLGGGGTVAASQNDLPGDALYKVKIASENITEALTFSPGSKAERKAEVAAKRVNELVALKKRDGTVSAEAVTAASDRYEVLLASIDSITDKLKPNQKLVINPRVIALITGSVHEWEQIRSSTPTSTREIVDQVVTTALNTELTISEQENDAAKQEPSLIGLKHRAENKINEVTRKVASVKANFLLASTSTTSSTSAKMATAEALLADAQVKFATGTYAEAFTLAKQAQRAAIEATQALHRTKHDVDVRKEKGDEQRLNTNVSSTTAAEANRKDVEKRKAEIEVNLRANGKTNIAPIQD